MTISVLLGHFFQNHVTAVGPFIGFFEPLGIKGPLSFCTLYFALFWTLSHVIHAFSITHEHTLLKFKSFLEIKAKINIEGLPLRNVFCAQTNFSKKFNFCPMNDEQKA